MPLPHKSSLALRWVFLTTVPVILVKSSASLSFGNFNLESGHALVRSTISSQTARDFVECAFACSAESRCLSFNFGKNPNDNKFVCEISNSVKEWDPQNFQSRPGFDYYTTTDRLVVHPCLSSPCSNGGTCVEDKGSYTCNCTLQIAVLPYIDDKCNVQRSLIGVSRIVKGVFLAYVKGQRYPLNFYEAERLCQLSGAAVASYDQLYLAWRANFDSCSYGWLADGSVRYPMQRRLGGCGGRGTIIGSSKLKDKLTHRANVYCYKQSP